MVNMVGEFERDFWAVMVGSRLEVMSKFVQLCTTIIIGIEGACQA